MRRRTFLRGLGCLVVIGSSVSIHSAAADKPKPKKKPAAKKPTRLPPPPPSKPNFSKIICEISGGTGQEKRDETTTVTGDGKYELCDADGKKMSGNLTNGQIESLNKRVGEVKWREVKKSYPGAKDSLYANLTVTLAGKTQEIKFPLDQAAIPGADADLPAGLSALVEEMNGVYKRYIGGDRAPKPKKNKK